MGMKFVDQVHGICDQLVSEACYLVKPHDEADVASFASRLCGLEGMALAELRTHLAGLEIPGDFRHLRLHNLTNGMPWGGRYSVHQSQLTFDEFLIIVATVLKRDDVTDEGPGVWTETVPMPIIDPGVLELGLIFRPLN